MSGPAATPAREAGFGEALWARARAWLMSLDVVDLVLRFTLVALLVSSHHEPVLMLVTAIVCVILLGQTRLLHHPAAWLIGAAALLVWQVPRWYEFDDHVLLATLWVLGVGCCLLTTSPGRSLRTEGRWMIGLIFGLAIAWKFGSDDFRTGRFFEHSLLLDGRFAFVADWFGGVDEATHRANREAVQVLTVEPTGWVQLQTDDALRRLALVFTGWGLLIETTLALTWLLPLRERWRWLRHVALLAFVVTTYAVVPVGGFGCLLLAMAMTQDEDLPWLRGAYAAAFGALVAYGPIWSALFAR